MVVKTLNNLGEIYKLDDKRGSIYIDNELICKVDYLTYGYNINSIILNKDDIIDKDKVLKATSKMWRYSNCIDDVVSLIKNGVEDVKYVHTVNYNVKTYKDYDREKDINLLLDGKL